MMQMASFHPRDERILTPVVSIPEDANTRNKLAKMMVACKYQRFDPVAVLKAFILRWNTRMSRAKEEFRMSFSKGGHEEEWVGE